MFHPFEFSMRRGALLSAALAVVVASSGCTVLAVADAAASLAVGAASAAVSVATTTVKVGAKAVGAALDATSSDSKEVAKEEKK